MGLLDELKQKADQLKKELSDDESKRRQKESYYQEVLLPTIQKIFKFLHDLTDHLKVVNPKMDIAYTIPGYGELNGLTQGNYSIRTDSELQTKRVILCFICASPKEIQFSVHGTSEVEDLNAFLRKHHIQYSEWGLRDQDRKLIGATFQLKFQIEATFQFDADVENGRIILTIRNFEEFNLTQKSYKAEQITDEWLDSIGRYILRMQKELHLDNVPEETLEKIRQQLKTENLEREQELEAAIERHKAEEELEKASRLGHQIRNTISDKLNHATDTGIGNLIKQKLSEIRKKK